MFSKKYNIFFTYTIVTHVVKGISNINIYSRPFCKSEF